MPDSQYYVWKLAIINFMSVLPVLCSFCLFVQTTSHISAHCRNIHIISIMISSSSRVKNIWKMFTKMSWRDLGQKKNCGVLHMSWNNAADIRVCACQTSSVPGSDFLPSVAVRVAQKLPIGFVALLDFAAKSLHVLSATRYEICFLCKHCITPVWKKFTTQLDSTRYFLVQLGTAIAELIIHRVRTASTCVC